MEENVRFPVGDLILEGLVSLPAPAARAGVVVCHPHPLFGGEMRNNVVEGLVIGLQRAGYATLRFNFRGVAGSSGEHGEGISEVADVKGAVSYLLGRQTFETVVVAGYSFGSIVGLKAGSEDPRVHKLIGIALPLASRDASFLLGVTKPKLLISGDRDDISPVAKVRALYEQLMEPKELVVVSGVDHFWARREIEAADAALRFLDG